MPVQCSFFMRTRLISHAFAVSSPEAISAIARVSAARTRSGRTIASSQLGRSANAPRSVGADNWDDVSRGLAAAGNIDFHSLHTHPEQMLLKRKHRVFQALGLDIGPGVQYQREQIERLPERDTRP